MITAYSFTRFSTPAQTKGDSVRRQLAKAERFAAERGLNLDTSLRLNGVSAFKGKHRKKGALAEFLAQIEAGEIARGSFLIVENIDRLSRENPWDGFPLMQQIINAGVVVVSLIDGIEYSLERLRSQPELMNTLQAVLTKGYRESRDKADRLQEVWAEKRAELVAGGRRKLTRQGPGWLDLIPDDPTEPLVGEWRFNERLGIVQRAYALCIAGLGKEAIVRQFNAEGLKSFKGGDGWNASTLALLLSDRRVIGELQLYTKVSGSRQPIGEPIKGYFPAAIDEDTFYRAQAEIAKRWCGAQPGNKSKVPNIFVGTAQCRCGRKMEFRDRQGRCKPSPSSVYLTCTGARRSHECDNTARFPYVALEMLVLDWVTDIQVSDEDANKAAVTALKLTGKEAERDDTKRRLNSAFAKWEAEEDDHLKAMLYASVQRYSAALPKIDAEIAELAEVVRTTKRSAIDDQRANVRRFREQLASAQGEAPFEMRAKLAAALRQVIDHIEFEDGPFTVYLRGSKKAYRFRDGRFSHVIDVEGSSWLKLPSAAEKKAAGWFEAA